MTDRTRVFLTYATDDVEPARELTQSMLAAGVNVWSDVESDGHRLEQELREAGVIVMLLTAESVKSPWIYFTLGAAIEGEKCVIPVLSESLQPADVPPMLQKYPAVSGREPIEAGRRVAMAIEQFEADTQPQHCA